jgi:hypothetical protein
MPFFLGSILYVGLLLTNAIAVLSEERFLARSASCPLLFRYPSTAILTPPFSHSPTVGWSTLSTSHLQTSANAGFGHVPNTYDAGGAAFGQPGTEGQSIKARMITLIAAVRTLMRSE